MAERIKSGIKQNRQNMKRRERNMAVRSSLRTSIKNLLSSIGDKDSEKSQSLLKVVIRSLDKAATKGVIHKRKASRYISRFSRKVNQLSAAS